ncbi:beta-ketoacyl-ACP reductase [Candidatus Kaiserbacteria bacterium RIFCSPHIGHO2_01_FULL_53_31]|uniref:Beta-ketoacyl-ACP reductase n=1 Tax=Candidatus Kaiserbacteria bacterium RIFCSPHIGHO2_01_FULL_53_31 TaxID=1798481 RepID=A0A1F6CJ25_9BACT|nr:MAG: beta-ketoacyl-ACP reductase [Candidatus Kaiserbacteria bacterium RIFCSPHIGHO2_01_FULL_53_31]
MRFKDKVAVITGSSRGIGKATAIAFAREGAKVVVNYANNKVAADETVIEINKAGGEVVAIQADVANEADVKRLMTEAATHFGGIDVLVNNAGIVIDSPLLEKTAEQWEHTLGVNLIGTFLCIKHAVPHMRGRMCASIINISSTNGIDTLSPESADYDISKAGVISLTKNFAQELAPEIRVNCVAPGWVDTDINAGLEKEYIEGEIQHIALKRWGSPEEIAKAVVFLASEDASFITGATLVVDGGYQ